VLRDDGTLWLNLGDSYAHNVESHNSNSKVQTGNRGTEFMKTPKRNFIGSGIKTKDLIGIPWRVAFALQADGWYLRQDIIWAKPNPMPESVRDRCTKSHEYIFLLSKGPKYYFDNVAIKEPIAESSKDRLNQNISDQEGSNRVPGKTNGNMKAVGCLDGKRNKRDVWTVATKPCKEAHFATFPPELIRPCILAGCPEGGRVLDPFMGTGTTAMVSKEEGRNYVGFELNPAYIEIAEKRIAKVKSYEELMWYL
jgi:DNA modification methylase